MSLFSVLAVPPLESGFVKPFVNAEPMFFPVFEISRVDLAVFVSNGPLWTRHFIVWKSSFVFPFIAVFVFPITMLLSMDEFALITWNTPCLYPSLLSVSIRVVCSPFALVTIPYFLKYKDASAFGLLLLYISLVVPSLWTDKSSLAIRHPFWKITSIKTSIFIN